jgi:hypothetical protein
MLFVVSLRCFRRSIPNFLALTDFPLKRYGQPLCFFSEGSNRPRPRDEAPRLVSALGRRSLRSSIETREDHRQWLHHGKVQNQGLVQRLFEDSASAGTTIPSQSSALPRLQEG